MKLLRSSIISRRLGQLLLRGLLLWLLIELRLELLGNSRHRWRAGLERLLLGSAGLERLLLRSASLEGLLLRSTCLVGHLLLGSRLLAREAGKLGLELARSLRLRLLDPWVASVLVLKRLCLSVPRGLGREGTRLLLLLLLLARLLTERRAVLLGPTGAATVGAAHEGVRL